MIGFFYLMMAILCTAFGQFYYKLFTSNKKKRFYYLTILMFICTPLFSMLALKYISIDIVYIFTSLTILLVVILSNVYLKEKVYKKEVIGIGFIILGVVIYGF